MMPLRKTLKAPRRAAPKHLVAGLVEVLGDLVGGGLLLVDDLGHHAGPLRVDGSADVAHGQVEELRSHLRHLAEVGHLAVGATRSLVFTVAPTSLAALARSFAGLGLVGQFLGLGG